MTSFLTNLWGSFQLLYFGSILRDGILPHSFQTQGRGNPKFENVRGGNNWLMLVLSRGSDGPEVGDLEFDWETLGWG